MSIGTESVVKQIVVSPSAFGPNEIVQITSAIGKSYSNYRELREATGELEEQPNRSPATNARLGVCLYLLGRYSDAVETLAHSDGGALTHFYLGQSRIWRSIATPRHSRPTSRPSGPAIRAIRWRWPRPKRCATTTARKKRSTCSTACPAPWSRRPNICINAPPPFRRWAAIRAKSSRCWSGPSPPTAAMPAPCSAWRWRTIATATTSTLAICTSGPPTQFPTHVGTLLNLGVLYEDMQQYEKARQCYRRILDVFPDHPRARLFFKDADASRDMYYDEDARRRQDRLSQILGIPVTDFELSVRSRNCLQKMGIMTLGDLTRTSEQELLASKNFGETSLVEIRDMLHSKGLELGQFADQIREEEPAYDPETLSADERAMLDRPIADLNLSVRARKCMVRLGLSTIGELVRRTGDDLLECKNFGVTSLNEVREKLTIQGLKLRGD